ncbi:MAG: DUF2974 domain-containing protein, partial [Bacteroidales bacterium]|nr:DUF2974 domain-containing protein [Bacteroidales bacterium]
YTNEQTKEEIAREEWLNKLDKMSEDELKNRESIYKTYLDMASMAEYSYKDGSIKEKDLPNGWQEVKFENDPNLSNIINMANNNDDGFQCSLLMNEEGKYVLSFRGTNEIIKDGKEDVNGIFTPDSPQARLALQTTEKLLNSGIIKKENLQLTGHSLGGRLASEVAVEYGLTAYTFNSAGVSLQTKNKIRNDLEKMNNSGKIINVCSANDKLTTVQNLGSFFADNHYLKPISNFLLTNNTLKSQQKQNILDKGTILIRNALFGADVRNVGGRKVISDAYGGHSITALRTSIGRRYADIQNKLNQNY